MPTSCACSSPTWRHEREDTDESSDDEGSVGQVLETMCQGFLGMSLRTATRLYREDPARFELVLYDHLDPLAGVIA